MSQRVHNYVNNGSLDTVPCDMHAGRLVPKEKARCTSAKGVTKVSRDNLGPTDRAVRHISLRHISTAKAESAPRKETFADKNALVEVSVKSENRRLNCQIDNKEPWGKILKYRASGESGSSFTNFDPLRTVHFLTQELQCKIQQTVPDDVNIQQMISEIQQALNRIPSDTPVIPKRFSWKDHDKCDLKPVKLISIENKQPFVDPSKLTDGTSQTPCNLYVEPEKLQQHLEESSEKIEKACRQMELLCSKLKMEKEDLEHLLVTEKENVRILHKQVDEQKGKYNISNNLLQSFKSKNEELEANVRRLQIQLDSQQGPSAKELRSFVQELQKKKSNAEEECMLLKQQLTFANMEIEKYEAILQARDTQIKEIRSEMTQLQEVVNEQLLDLQNNPCSSDEASVSNTTASPSSTCTGFNIKNETNKNINQSHNTLSSINTNDMKMKEVFQSTVIKECQTHSGNTSATSDSNSKKERRTTINNHSRGRPKTKLTKKKSEKMEGTITNQKELLEVRDKLIKLTKQALAYKGLSNEM